MNVRLKTDAEWLELTKALPAEPGVYLMKDLDGRVIYVGKAKNLRSRVSSYFQDGTSDYRAFIAILANVLGDIETAITSSEKEALILERELIRRHEPRFNIIWRDDKQYLCLRVDPSHEYPRVEVVRNLGKDGARYFGPFHSATAARQTLRVVNRQFQLRTCRDSVLYNRSRPCLEYQIGRCPAPCVFEIDREKYKQNVDDVIMFLEGKKEALVEQLEARMWEAANRTEYEIAARTRDQIGAIKKTLEPQRAVLPSMRDQDVIGVYREGGDFMVAVLAVRAGRVENIDAHFFEDQLAGEAEVLESFLLQFYNLRDDMPAEVLVGTDFEGREALEELLSEKRGRRVSIKLPKRGERARLLDLSQENAEHAYAERYRKNAGMRAVLENLQKRLHLTKLPERIECFDISNLQGKMIVGSQVTFVRGTPTKKYYRRYKVRGTEGQDDFRAMYEVLSRRLVRAQKENDFPDLIVIDGGKGQLNVVRAAMKDLGIENLDVVALAKSRTTGSDQDDASVRSPERVFLPGAKEPIVLHQSSKELLLLTRIRDEAHRFAITFHKQLRTKGNLRSALEEVPGIGKIRKRALLRTFGSLKRIREASLEELEAVPGLGKSAASVVFEFLHGGAKASS